MPDRRIVRWSQLPHEAQVGHGKEGLVLRLNENECIKIYSPQKVDQAGIEYVNASRLIEAGFLVSKPKEIVQVELDTPDVKLPGSFMRSGGIGLYQFPGVTTVPGVVREYIEGEAFGIFTPSWKNLRELGFYVDRLRDNDFTFTEGRCLDYVLSPKGVTLVDAGSLYIRGNEQLLQGEHQDFDDIHLDYESRLFHSVMHELENQGKFDPLTQGKLALTNLLRVFS